MPLLCVDPGTQLRDSRSNVNESHLDPIPSFPQDTIKQVLTQDCIRTPAHHPQRHLDSVTRVREGGRSGEDDWGLESEERGEEGSCEDEGDDCEEDEEGARHGRVEVEDGKEEEEGAEE